MSFELPPIAPIAASRSVHHAASHIEQTRVAHTGDAVEVATVPLSPPPEVHAAIAVAADAYHKLAALGNELSFRIDASTGKLKIEVHDLKGNVLYTVPSTKALQIASGGNLD